MDIEKLWKVYEGSQYYEFDTEWIRDTFGIEVIAARQLFTNTEPPAPKDDKNSGEKKDKEKQRELADFFSLRADRPALKSALDSLYFNDDETELKECLKEFWAAGLQGYSLAEEDIFGRVIDEIASDLDATINPTLLQQYSSNLLKGVRGVFGDIQYGDRHYEVGAKCEPFCGL